MKKILIYIMISASSLALAHNASTMSIVNEKTQSLSATMQKNGTEDVIAQYINNSTIPVNPTYKNSKTAKNKNLAPAGEQKQQVRPYTDIIRQHALNNNVPVDLAHAVIRAESNYNKNALGRAGEIGLMQIKLSTARGLGYHGTAKGLYEPNTNIEYGMKYLGKATALGEGDTCTTLLKYNAGHNAKKMNNATTRYCSKIKSFMAALD